MKTLRKIGRWLWQVSVGAVAGLGVLVTLYVRNGPEGLQKVSLLFGILVASWYISEFKEFWYTRPLMILSLTLSGLAFERFRLFLLLPIVYIVVIVVGMVRTKLKEATPYTKTE